MRAYVRIVIKSDSLGDMHVAIAEAEDNGWVKAGGLLYTYMDGVQGWEITMERPMAIDEPDDGFFVGTDSGSVGTGVAVSVILSCFVVAAVIMIVAGFQW